MQDAVFLVIIGCVIGVYATALGAGGAFLITPLLLLRYPTAEPELVATASLTIVALSSGASSLVSIKTGRADYLVVALLAVAVIPAAIAGAVASSIIPRDAFSLGFAVLLIAMAVWVSLPHRPATLGRPVRGLRRFVTDRSGATYSYVFPVVRSMAVVVGEAFLSATAGIGGGPLYTPLEVRVMRIPVELAVPMAHLVITALALSALALHGAAQHFGEPLRDVPWLAAGMLAANPLGHRLNRRLGEGPILRLLAIGLVVVGLRTALGAGDVG